MKMKITSVVCMATATPIANGAKVMGDKPGKGWLVLDQKWGLAADL